MKKVDLVRVKKYWKKLRPLLADGIKRSYALHGVFWKRTKWGGLVAFAGLSEQGNTLRDAILFYHIDSYPSMGVSYLGRPIGPIKKPESRFFDAMKAPPLGLDFLWPEEDWNFDERQGELERREESPESITSKGKYNTKQALPHGLGADIKELDNEAFGFVSNSKGVWTGLTEEDLKYEEAAFRREKRAESVRRERERRFIQGGTGFETPLLTGASSDSANPPF